MGGQDYQKEFFHFFFPFFMAAHNHADIVIGEMIRLN